MCVRNYVKRRECNYMSVYLRLCLNMCLRCLDMCDFVWICATLFGYVRLCLDMCNSDRMRVTVSYNFTKENDCNNCTLDYIIVPCFKIQVSW